MRAPAMRVVRPVFNVADPATWPVLLNAKHLAALFGRTPGGILRACTAHKFVPAPCQTHPTLWRRIDVLRFVEGARGSSLRRVGAIALLLLLPTAAFAQDAPVQEKPAEVGMSPWAFKFALLGQVADIVSTETALAVGGVESNPIMRHRAVRISTKLAIPVLARWAYKKVGLPRAQSNANAVVMGGLGFGPAAWNVFITVKLANR